MCLLLDIRKKFHSFLVASYLLETIFTVSADPGIFFRGGGGGGGGGGPGLASRKQSRQGFLFSFIIIPQLILQFTEGVQHFPRGDPTFSRGGGGGGGGPNANFYRNPYNL